MDIFGLAMTVAQLPSTRERNIYHTFFFYFFSHESSSFTRLSIDIFSMTFFCQFPQFMGVWERGGKNLTVSLSFLPFSTFIYNSIKLSTLEHKIHFQFLRKTFFFKEQFFIIFIKIDLLIHSKKNPALEMKMKFFLSRLVYFLKFNLFRELLELDWLTTCCCFSLLWFFFSFLLLLSSLHFTFTCVC